MSLNAFKSDSAYGAIFKYLGEMRSNSANLNDLFRVSVVKGREYSFYRLQFNQNGMAFEKIMAINLQTEEIYIIFEDQIQNSFNQSGSTPSYVASGDDLVVDSLIKNAYPDLLSSKIMKVEKDMSSGREVYKYYYVINDKIWIFNVSRGSNGQYEISQEGKGTQKDDGRRPGSRYELTKDEI